MCVCEDDEELNLDLIHGLQLEFIEAVSFDGVSLYMFDG